MAIRNPNLSVTESCSCGASTTFEARTSGTFEFDDSLFDSFRKRHARCGERRPVRVPSVLDGPTWSVTGNPDALIGALRERMSA